MAPPRRFLARSLLAQWVLRGALAMLVLGVGYSSVTRSLAYVIQDDDPPRAHLLAPNDGPITALLANRQLADGTSDNQVAASRLSRMALQQDPTAVLAVTTLGLQAQLRGDAIRARNIFGYAEILSRRDLQSQLWMIEDAVGLGDIDGALHHYDVALRTSAGAPDVLYPVLSGAIANSAIRSSLIATLAKRPPWGAEFVNFVASSGADPHIAAALLVEMQRAKLQLSPESIAATINRLFAANAFEDAWDLYAALRPGVDRRSARDGRFIANLSAPSVFDWTPINNESIATTIELGASGGVVDFSAPATVGGILLQQGQMLPPGDYRLEGHSSGIDQAPLSLPYWTLICQDGRELGQVVVPNSAQADGTFAGKFSVPPACVMQLLALVARPSDATSGVSGQIDRLNLRLAR